MIRRTALTLAAVISPGAASVGAQAHATIADQREMHIDIRLRGFSRRILLDTLAVWTDITQPPRIALADARFVLDSLKLPIIGVDTLARVVYNNGFVSQAPPATWKDPPNPRCSARRRVASSR